MEAKALETSARDFGMGRRLDPGLPAFGESVSLLTSPPLEPPGAIGPAGVLASPLSLAGIAATVAEARRRAPRLAPDRPSAIGRPLAGTEPRDLRGLTGQVVTEGTAEVLANVPGEVYGKTGTAEYGRGDPPPTHAWFTGYRGDLAVAVLVERVARAARWRLQSQDGSFER